MEGRKRREEEVGGEEEMKESNKNMNDNKK